MSQEFPLVHLFVRRLRHGHFRHAGTQVLVFAVVLLLSGMVLLGANVSSLENDFERVRHSNQTLLTLAEIDKEAIGVEFSVRGLALTAHSEYREFFANRRAHLRRAMAQLSQLLAGDAGRMRDAAKMRGLLEKRIARLEGLISDGSPSEVARAIVQAQVRQDRYDALAIVKSLRERTLSTLEAEYRVSHDKSVATYHQAMVIVASAFLLIALGLFLVYGGGRQSR